MVGYQLWFVCVVVVGNWLRLIGCRYCGGLALFWLHGCPLLVYLSVGMEMGLVGFVLLVGWGNMQQGCKKKYISLT